MVAGEEEVLNLMCYILEQLVAAHMGEKVPAGHIVAHSTDLASRMVKSVLAVMVGSCMMFGMYYTQKPFRGEMDAMLTEELDTMLDYTAGER